MFGNITLPKNRMLSFDCALRKYESIKPIRGRSDQNTRPLARRGNDNLTIRQDPTTGNIVVRLYYTDIITYLSEGDGYNNPIELHPYASALTNRVVWSILGPHVNTYWSDRSGCAPDHITEVGGRYYHTPDYVLVQPRERGWYVIGGAKPFEVNRVDRKAARQVLKETGYYTFKLWLETMVRLGTDPRPRGTSWKVKAYDWSPFGAHRYLTGGPSTWPELVNRMSCRVSVEAELASLRSALYRYAQCYHTESVPYFETYEQLTSGLNAMRRWD